MMIADIWLTPQMIPELCRELGVHRTTVARWLRERKLPKTVEALLDITHNGNLGRIHSKWNGWKIDPKGGDLMRPDRSFSRPMAVSAGEIMSTQYRFQQLSVLKSANAELTAKTESQEKTIEALRTQVADQQRVIERLETRLAELTGGNMAPTSNAAQTHRFGLSKMKPNG